MKRTTVAAVALLALLLTSCSSNREGSSQSTLPPEASAAQNVAPEAVGPVGSPSITVTQGGFRYRVQFLNFDETFSLAGLPIAPPGRKYVTIGMQVTNLQDDRPAPGPRGLGYLSVSPENGELYRSEGFLGSSERCVVGGNQDARVAGSQEPQNGLPPATRGIPEGWCLIDVELSDGTPRRQLAPGGSSSQIYYARETFEDGFDPASLQVFVPQDDPQTAFGGFIQAPTS